MSKELREALREVAASSPALAAPPSGLFDRARRDLARRRATTTLAIVLAVVAIGFSTSFFPTAPLVTASSTEIPRYFVQPPKWTADVRDAPIERAVLAFVLSSEPHKLILVGPDSAYRTYTVPAEGYSTWTPSFLLSPDGRSLLVARGQTTELLDLGTGRRSELAIGAPLAWSRDGTQAIVANAAAGELRVVRMPDGAQVWRIPLRPAEDRVAAAFSPDLTKVAVQQGAVLTVHQRTGVMWNKDVGAALYLAGPFAWTEEGTAVAITKLTTTHVFNFLDAETGGDAGQVPNKSALQYVTAQGRSDGLPSVVAWHEGAAIVNAGNRSLLKLDIPYNVLMTAAEGTRDLQVASIGTDWAATDPNPPDPGPALQRYRGAVDMALPALLGLLGLIVVAVRFWPAWLAPRRRA